MHVDPTSLHNWLFFDVGMGEVYKLWCDHKPHPNQSLQSFLNLIWLGRTGFIHGYKLWVYVSLEVWIWGYYSSMHVPTAHIYSSSNQPITDISCGDGHNLALSSTGVVYSWGDNSVSQLGLSVSYTEVTKPRQVNIPSGFQVSQVACGANFSAALTSQSNNIIIQNP